MLNKHIIKAKAIANRWQTLNLGLADRRQFQPLLHSSRQTVKGGQMF